MSADRRVHEASPSAPAEGLVPAAVDITDAEAAKAFLLDTAAALARSVDPERALRELGSHARLIARSDGVAVAVASGPGTTRRFSVLYAAGFDGEDSAVAERFAYDWSRAIDGRRVVRNAASGGHAITAPIVESLGRAAAVTLVLDSGAPAVVVDAAARALEMLAAHAVVAFERASMIELASYKRRVESIGEVASRVANELRTPLFGISSAAQLLRFRAREDPVVEKNVGRILREVEWLNRVVSALLDYGRPAELSLVSENPDAIWDTVIADQRGRLESRSLHVNRTRAEPAAHCRIDRAQIAQVFSNLLANAIDAAPEASDLTLVSSVNADTWQCRLTNAGPPIPRDSVPRIFDLFYSTKPGATGIGLALARRIVEGHGGTIAVESTERVGTTLMIGLRH
jgi:signal transduction histidine kinase